MSRQRPFSTWHGDVWPALARQGCKSRWNSLHYLQVTLLGETGGGSCQSNCGKCCWLQWWADQLLQLYSNSVGTHYLIYRNIVTPGKNDVIVHLNIAILSCAYLEDMAQSYWMLVDNRSTHCIQFIHLCKWMHNLLLLLMRTFNISTLLDFYFFYISLLLN